MEQSLLKALNRKWYDTTLVMDHLISTRYNSRYFTFIFRHWYIKLTAISLVVLLHPRKPRETY